MTRAEIFEALGFSEEVNFLDGPDYDECIVGAVRFYDPSYGQRHVLLYDEEGILEALVRNSDGEMTREEAQEFFEFNTIGAWMGKGTPAFFTRLEDRT